MAALPPTCSHAKRELAALKGRQGSRCYFSESNKRDVFTFFLLLQKEPKSSREGCDPPTPGDGSKHYTGMLFIENETVRH